MNYQQYLSVAISLLLIHFMPRNATAQTADTTTQNTFNVEVYVDGYYANRSTNNGPDTYDPYTTVGARDNSIGLNVAQLSLSYQGSRVRANLVYHAGDIPGATWSSEFPNVQQGNVGLRLVDNWWLDAGFFTTHIGAESFLPRYNFLSSTAVLTFNEPFYQAGARLHYDDPNSDWEVQLWALNGYNLFVDNNSAKSFGVLLSRAVGDNGSLTYTNLIGREPSDGVSANPLRVYQNLYYGHEFAGGTQLLAGTDFGIQATSDLDDPDGTATMWTALLALRQPLTDEWSLAARAEAFQDPDGFIGGTLPNAVGVVRGVELFGFTLGGEYRPQENAYFRLETRYLAGPEEARYFSKENGGVRDRLAVMFTAGAVIGRDWNW